MFRFIWYWSRVILAIVLGTLVVWFGYEGVNYYFTRQNIIALKTENPTTTSMIEYRLSEARKEGKQGQKYQIWVPIERISPNLQRAVIAGEDTNFVSHQGFDWKAIEAAWQAAQKEAEKEAKAEGDSDPNAWIPSLDKDSIIDSILVSLGYPKTSNFKRGASTITQQLAKNLYLSEERSFLRKGREYLVTRTLENNLNKRRILEIYLNVIEWGDGIYGAEAAARTYFKKSAADLSPQEAAYLSAMIPSPLNIFNPSKNPKRVNRRARVIARGMNHVKIP
ncbi:MAG: transglycosylase domain-containing protein [Acidobacteriota bacterium]|nr:transglycosylase domain-containing protein [Acidobacteriota bacterium]